MEGGVENKGNREGKGKDDKVEQEFEEKRNYGDWDDIVNYEQNIYLQNYQEGKDEAMKSSYEEGKEFGYVPSLTIHSSRVISRRYSQGYLLSLELEFMKSSLEKILLLQKNDEDVDHKNERLIQRCSQLIEKINQVPMEVGDHEYQTIRLHSSQPLF
jgi:hypothetical protein